MSVPLRTMLLVAAGMLTGVFAGCMAGPNYKRPAAAVPPAFKEIAPSSAATGVAWKAAGANVAPIPAHWWEAYNDVQLDRLETQLIAGNQNLRAAVAVYTRSREQIQVDRSALFPTLGGYSGASRNHVSGNRPFVVPGSNNEYGDFTVEGNASWEPDFWGRIRRAVESSRSNAQASAADVAALQLSLQAQLAIDYFQLRALDRQLQLLDSTVADFKKAVELTQLRFNAGLSSASDVALAQTQLDQTEAQASDLGVARAQYENALATLTGTPASSFSLPAAMLMFKLPAVPAQIPSELLERRPDIAAAERRVAAANAEIGVAQAAYYPTIQLGGVGGFESVAAGSWITGSSAIWSLGSSASQILFDAGRRHAIKQQAIASYDQATAQYRQTVLSSFEETEDSLAALRVLAAEQTQVMRAVADAQRSLDLSLSLYKRGLANYLQVITVETTLLNNQRTLVDIGARQATANVQLFKALGGGWTVAQLPH